MRKKDLIRGLKFAALGFLILAVQPGVLSAEQGSFKGKDLGQLLSAYESKAQTAEGQTVVDSGLGLVDPQARPKISSELIHKIAKHKAERVKENQDINFQPDKNSRILAVKRLRQIRIGQRAVPKYIKVVFELSSPSSMVNYKLSWYGASIKNRYQNLVEVEIPIDNIEAAVKGVPEIKRARSPKKFFPSAVTSEGVGLTAANAFQSAGYKGKGVKVAVLDGGFKGLTAAKNTGELPANIIVENKSGSGLEAGSVHGTACAEIIYDMAPEVQIYAVKFDSDVQFGLAVDYCIAQGVDVISFSMGTIDGPGNGTGDLCNIINNAKSNGILWVNSAGNYAEMTSSDGYKLGFHWQGLFSDTNSDNVHEFGAGDNMVIGFPDTDDDGNPLTDEVTIIARWNDWPAANTDYDLYLIDTDSGAVLASSTDVQNGSQEPVEMLTYDVPQSATDGVVYYIELRRKSGEPAGIDVELFALGSCVFYPYYTKGSSITEPASAEGAFAVGAIDEDNWASGTLEEYSSQGPTNNWAGSAARIKPDICGPDDTASYTYGGDFPGTSAAAPHVAGAAALLLSVYPNMTVDQLRAELEAKAGDLGDSGKDNVYGAGKLNLPSPVTYLQNVVINEFVPNPDGSNSEWVELYNKGSQAVNIGGCWLLDSRLRITDVTKKIPDGTIIQPGKFYVHTLDSGDGYLNNSGGDMINFIAPDGVTVIDFKDYTSTKPDCSIYRLPDGGSWQSNFDNSPTKNSQNNGPSAPQISSVVPDLDTDEDVVKVYDLTQNEKDEIDSDTELVWSIDGVDTNLFNAGVDAVTDILTITPVVEKSGSDTIKLTLINSVGLTATQYITVTINSINDPPTIAGVPNQQGTEDIPWGLDASGFISDVDNDKSTLTITENSNYASVTGQTITFNYPNNVTNEEVTITVSDGEKSSGQTITVNVTAVNDPPVVSQIPDQALDEDTTKTINLDDYVLDIDNLGPDIAWTYSGNTNIAVSIDTQTRIATFSPAANYSGSEDITFKATDPEGLSDSKTAKVTVNPINDAPVVSDINNQTIQQEVAFLKFDLDDFVSDVDNNDSQITWTYSGNDRITVAVDSDKNVTLTYLAAPWTGEETITFTATDPAGASAFDSAIYKVTGANEEFAFIFGKVKDPSGNIVAGATVTLRSVHSTYYSVTTDASGIYKFTNVVPGSIYFLFATPPSQTVYAMSSIQVNAFVAGMYADKDIALQNNGITISGKVRDAVTQQPVKDINITYNRDDIYAWFTVKTSEAGDYSFYNMPKGEAIIIAKPGAAYAGYFVESDFQANTSNLDFSLQKTAVVSGKAIKDDNREPFSEVKVEFYGQFHGNSGIADSAGNFTFDTLANGIGSLKLKPDTSSGYAWSEPSPHNWVYVTANQTSADVTRYSKKGALVRGIVKDSQGNPVYRIQCKASGRYTEVWPLTDATGRFELRLPLGKNIINFGDYPVYCVLSKTVDINDVNASIDLPEFTAYTQETGTKITGSVVNINNYAKAGDFWVIAYEAGFTLSEETIYGLDLMAFFKFKAASAYELGALPPNKNYDLYLAAVKESDDGTYSIVLRDNKLNIAGGSNNINLNYTSEGARISGRILDTNTNPILGAFAVLKEKSTNTCKGVATTDQNGYYMFYNVPQGEYALNGLHSLYAASTTVTALITSEGSTIYPLDITMGDSVNNPPVFDSITDKIIDEGQELKFTVNATDADSPALTYSVNNLPEGASFDPATRKFKWTPSDTQGRAEQYTVTFSVSDGQLSASINVKIKVNNIEQPHSIPVVTITSPAGGSEVSGIAQVTASITNTSGLESVYAYLYVDSSSIALDVSAPYSFSWNTTSSANASHTLKVKASYSYYESDIKKTGWVESTAVSVVVNNPVYDVRITSPVHGATVSGAVNFQAAADGATFVYYYIDNNWSGISFSPYGYNWDTTKTYNGTHTIYIKAFYALQLRWVTSSAITLTVNNPVPPNTPALNIITPSEGQTVSGIVTVEAQLANATTSAVYFYIDNKYKYTDYTSPYIYLWDTTKYSDGSHTIKTTAYVSSIRKYVTRTCVVTVDN